MVSKILFVIGLNKNDLLEQFGESFFQFCVDSGYETILRSIGRDLRSFFCSLDSLHEHLATKYPGMRPPSFRVLDGPRPGTLIFRYASERLGLQCFVIGAAKAAARLLFKLDVKITPMITNSNADYSEFLITQNPDVSSNGNDIHLIDEPIVMPSTCSQDELETVMDPITFCQAFPFHVIFDRDLVICQAGASLLRIIPDLEPGISKFTAIFSMVRPHIPVTFESILSRENAVFIMKTREGWMTKPSKQDDSKAVENVGEDYQNDDDDSRTENIVGEDKALRLKGQMVFLPESDTILFLCSPRILSLDSLGEKGCKTFKVYFSFA